MWGLCIESMGMDDWRMSHGDELVRINLVVNGFVVILNLICIFGAEIH